MYGKVDKNRFNMLDIQHYFDGVEKQQLERGSLSRKSAKILALREKMIRLPDPAFDVIMKSLESMIESVTVGGSQGKEVEQQIKDIEKKQALALFERVAEADSHVSTRNISSIQKVS